MDLMESRIVTISHPIEVNIRVIPLSRFAKVLIKSRLADDAAALQNA
jgi:hypothetical protein